MRYRNSEAAASSSIASLESRINSVIKGKEKAVKLAVCTLLARGHLLIEDVPGVGKTTLALTLARAIDCSFQRIQFTSDMLPSDIIGVGIYNPDSRLFEFKKGPVFANIVLADEINRTTPKTQSALLEAMNERRVSVEGKTYVLPEPFMVIATQNPLEYHGTFPLPESQMDRFMLHLRLGYPGAEHEKEAIVDKHDMDAIDGMSPVVESGEIRRIQKEVEDVKADKSILDYLMAIITETRNNESIRLGASTRGAKFLLRAASASAYYEGRDYIAPEDVKEMAPHVLGHRILLKGHTNIYSAEKTINGILDEVPVPI